MANSAILNDMDSSAPASLRIRLNPWYYGTLVGALGISLAIDLFSGDTRLEAFELFKIGAWILGPVLLGTGVLNYMRVSTDSIGHYRNYIGARVRIPLRSGDQFVVTDEGAFIWRFEGYYEQLDVQPHWAGRREWNRLRAWAAEHWKQPVPPRRTTDNW